MRSYYQEQLHSRAYDTATSLSLSINSAPMLAASTSSESIKNDRPLISSMIDVIFDRGFYQQIRFEFVGDTPAILRTASSDSHFETSSYAPSMPNWFASLVAFNEASSQVDVMSGWQRKGALTVTSQPGFAYREMWQLSVYQVSWFAVIGILSLLSINLLLGKVFVPLKVLEQQAEGLSEKNDKRFILQPTEPKATEMKSAVAAMNYLVSHLNTLFDEQATKTEILREQSFRDSLTGLGNRRDFEAQVSSAIDQHDAGAGVLVFLQLADFSAFNHEEGKQAGDQLLKNVANGLRLHTVEMGNARVMARRSGADFALYFHVSDKAHGETLVNVLFDKLNTGVLSNLIFHLGCVYHDNSNVNDTKASAKNAEQKLNELQTYADNALCDAQQKMGSNYQWYQHEVKSIALDNGMPTTPTDWHAFLIHTLDARQLTLHYQPVVDSEGQLLQVEVLSRIAVGDTLINASRFWPMVELFQLSSQFDQLVILGLVDEIEKNSATTDYCVNVSAASILDDEFCTWLESIVLKHPQLSERLVIEVSEQGIHLIEESLLKLFDRLKPYGIRLSIDHFGTGALAFNYLQRLPVSLLKVDKRFIRNIAQHKDQKHFVRSMVPIVKSLNLALYAEGVESKEEWDEIQEIGLNGAAGFYFSKPEKSLSAVQSALIDWSNANEEFKKDKQSVKDKG
jgi:diguanylate cyclase (GGDEF)-like protein